MACLLQPHRHCDVGDGHVVCHNAISGFGDAIKFTSTGFTSEDVYNNEVTSSYDNSIELDGALRNVRCTRNRFTNSYAPISFQPIYGGPVYVWRTVVVNVANEALKIHALGEPPDNQDPSGMLIYHNTFVSSDHALFVNTSATGHYFELRNNLFVGPAAPSGRIVEWDGVIDHGTLDFDGFYTPNAGFRISGQSWANLAALKTSGPYEFHSTALTATTFASGLTAPPTYTTALSPKDVSLSTSSPAVNAGTWIYQFSDGANGVTSDLGAIGLGCPVPLYGPRPAGTNESSEVYGCTP